MLVATGGFLGFALVLALVEQAFLEVLEGNVRVGSPVFESNHILLLAFGRSPRDKEMLLTITRQVRRNLSRAPLLSYPLVTDCAQLTASAHASLPKVLCLALEDQSLCKVLHSNYAAWSAHDVVHACSLQLAASFQDVQAAYNTPYVM